MSLQVGVKHIYSTKRENIDQQGYALYTDLCNLVIQIYFNNK